MKTVIRYSLLIAVIVGITYYVSKGWDIEALRALSLSPIPLVSSVLLLVVHFLLACKLSHRLIGIEKDIDFLSYQKIYFISQLGRYIPGKIWMVIGKFEALRQKGFDLYWVTAASLIEMALMVLGATTVSFVCLTLDPIERFGIVSDYSWLLLIGCIVGILLFKPLLVFFLGIAEKVIKKIETNVITHISSLKQKHVFLISTGYGVSWVIQGTAFYLLILSLKPELGFSPLFILTYTVSWLSGFFAVFAPSGIGVRESLMILLLSLETTTSEAAVIALLARVWATVTELGVAAFSLLFNRKLLRIN